MSTPTTPTRAPVEPAPSRLLHDALPPTHHDRHDLDAQGDAFAAYAATHPEWCTPAVTQ